MKIQKYKNTQIQEYKNTLSCQGLVGIICPCHKNTKIQKYHLPLGDNLVSSVPSTKSLFPSLLVCQMPHQVVISKQRKHNIRGAVMAPCFISLFFCCFISQFLFLFHVNVSSVSFPVSSHCVFCCFILQFLLFLFLFYFPVSNAHAWDKLPSSVPASSSHSPFLTASKLFTFPGRP